MSRDAFEADNSKAWDKLTTVNALRFGEPFPCALSTVVTQDFSLRSAAPELRWRIFDDLTTARVAFGLKDRTRAALRALLSPPSKGSTASLVAFPSDRTLSDRFLGMPESTLRRHLLILCQTGLIARRKSPSRKRYRVGNCPDLTFGLDLSPTLPSKP